jgi:hypothetical protein
MSPFNTPSKITCTEVTVNQQQKIGYEFCITSAQYTDKKEKLSFPHLLVNPDRSSCKVIRYMRKGILKYEEVRKYLTIYEEAVSHI